MNRICREKYQAESSETVAWHHAIPHAAVQAGYRPEMDSCAFVGVAEPKGRTYRTLTSGKGDQGQIVGAFQITPIKPIPSDNSVRVEVSSVCI